MFLTKVKNLLPDKIKQQNALVILNASQKIGALLLSAICTLLLNSSNMVNVIILMTMTAIINYII